MAMQVIYSAGTTCHSPKCSPVPPRKHSSPRPSPGPSPREWKPVMPGYRPPTGHVLVPYSMTAEVEHNPIMLTEDDTNLKDSIPAMPRSVAITCLICNILCPGLGTFLSGTTVFCCAKVRPKGTSKMSVLKTNSWVALLQFVTAFIFLLGWIWSIMWGASFIRISKKSYLNETEDGGDSSHNSTSDKSSAVSHRRNISSLTSPTTSTFPTTSTAPMSRNIQQTEQMPIIALQERPVVIHTNQQNQTGQTGSTRPLNPLNPRHNRILRHQCDQQLPSLFLDPQNLENIVVHHASTPDFMATNSSSETNLSWKG